MVIIHSSSDTTLSDHPDLISRCDACKAICCIMPSFDLAQGFGHSKPAFSRCRNLGADHTCTIHKNLKTEGYAGCLNYECFGTGQLVSAHLSLNDDWHENSILSDKVYRTFTRIKQVQELRLAYRKGLDEISEQSARDKLEARRQSIECMSLEELTHLSAERISELRKEVQCVLRQHLSL